MKGIALYSSVTSGLSTVFLSGSMAVGALPVREQPNFLVFLVDDLGWNDVSCYHNSFFETPAIDKLAASGVRFTNAYSACTVSSPSRAALMTGKYPARLHLTDWIAGHSFPYAKLRVPNWKMFLDPGELTIAEILKEKNYKTACIGKWHLGEDTVYWPEFNGFDINIGGCSKGQPGSYFSPYKTARISNGPEGEYLTDRLTEEALKFIRENKTRPFFLYMPHYAVHTPLQAKKEMIGKYKSKGNTQFNPIYGAMVESMDQSMAKLMAELTAQGLMENTFVIFMSDNGGLKPLATDNSPLRDGKGTAYEGGTRTPLIMAGPGIKKGITCDVPVITMDVFSTIIDLANLPESSFSNDGVSLLPLLKGKTISERPLFWHYPHYHSQGATPYSAVRKGAWKFYHFYEDGHNELYNLNNDISEQNNLLDSNASEATALNALLQDWLKNTNAQFAEPNPDYNPDKKRVKAGKE